MTLVKWMWNDARLFSYSLAQANPLRWSAAKSLEATINELKSIGGRGRPRPVRVKVLGGRETVHQTVDAAVAALTDRCGLLTQGGLRDDEREPSSLAAERKYRCQDPSIIPAELLRGPFTDFDLPTDVYATAYLVARNATPDMYSIWPWKNPQVRVVWAYLLFLIGSQTFVLFLVTFWNPPVTYTESFHVDCANVTMAAWLHRHGIISKATRKECSEEGKFLFMADVHGSVVSYYRFEQSSPFYKTVLKEGSMLVNILRLICCSWVFALMYFGHFASVRALFNYHDFSCWFLPLKDQEVRNAWASCIPVFHFLVILSVTTISFCIIFAQPEPFDIVMDSLAFTFIAEVGSYFNTPLVKRLATTKIDCLDEIYGDQEIYYLYPEYSPANAVSEDGTYTDGGWYICEDEEKAGLLSDYKVRHNPNVYPHRHDSLVKVLEIILLVAPPSAVCIAGLRCALAERDVLTGGDPSRSEL